MKNIYKYILIIGLVFLIPFSIARGATLLGLFQGGTGADLSGVVIGDIIAGNATGTIALVTATGHSDGDVLTLQADGSLDYEAVAAGSTITIADESADTSCYVGYFTAATGSLQPKTGTNLTFNSNTGVLTASGFAGPLTGNVTGNCSGSSGSCTGNAATVTNATLTTALTVNTGTLTLTAAGANNSVLTIGAGASSISGANTGDQTNVSGNAGTVTVDASTSDTTCFLGVFESASGSLEPQTDATLIYDANTGKLGTTQLNLGVATSALGVLTLSGNTSGTVTINTAAAAGTYSLTLPTTDGGASEFLQTNGSGVLTWASGGTGDVTKVGDCESGDCYDGTSDGGTYARFYDGDSNYTSLASSNVAATTAIVLPATAGTLALNNQTMYIGTTGVAINRGTAALTLAGITLTSPTLTGPALGTPASGTLTNCSFPTLNQNTTGSSGSCTGLAATATALAANGNNCAAGSYALGVNASGAAESCTDATTEINSVVNGLGGTGLTCAAQSCAVDLGTSIATGEIDADTITHANIADSDQTDTKCIWFEDPVATDDFKSIWANKTANDFLITEIWAESDQTVTFMLQVDDGTPLDVDTVDLAPAAGEAEDTSLDGDTTLAAGEELDLAITSVANTPTWVSICWTGNWVD